MTIATTDKVFALLTSLVFAARVIQIKVLDHIIIGDNRYFSFADEGLIEDYDVLFHRLQR